MASPAPAPPPWDVSPPFVSPSARECLIATTEIIVAKTISQIADSRQQISHFLFFIFYLTGIPLECGVGYSSHQTDVESGSFSLQESPDGGAGILGHAFGLQSCAESDV